MNRTRGYCTVNLSWDSFPWPNSLAPSFGAPDLSIGAFFERLESAGVNRLRVKLTGDNSVTGGGGTSFEPRRGQFNDWNGRAQDIVAAARDHGVSFHAIPFDNTEFRNGWADHAWNARNPGGFLHDARDAFSGEVALEAALNRIDAIADLLQETICGWELCAEMAWLCTPQFWQTGGWTEETRAQIRGELVPWVAALTSYIHNLHPAPVGNGHVFAPRGFSDDPDHPSCVRNEPFHADTGLDHALIVNYGEPLNVFHAYLRACQEWTGLPVYVEQYAPWGIGQEAPYSAPEQEPYSVSKAFEWLSVCGERGCVGPSRWPEIRPLGQHRQWYGIASPEMADIAGVTWEFAQHVDLDGWKPRGWSYDGGIVADNTRLVSAWGDGRHCTVFVTFGDSEPHDVIVYGLTDGAYSARAFDWLTGAQVSAIGAVASNGALELPGLPVVEGALVLYVCLVEPVPEPPTNDGPIVVLAVRDVETNEARAVALEPGREYRLEVEVRE